MSNSFDEWRLAEKELSCYSDSIIAIEFVKRNQMHAARNFDAMELSIDEKARLYKIIHDARLEFDKNNQFNASMQWELQEKFFYYEELEQPKGEQP